MSDPSPVNGIESGSRGAAIALPPHDGPIPPPVVVHVEPHQETHRGDTQTSEVSRRQTEAAAAAAPLPEETKKAIAKIQRIYVAVHGIGDQFQYATIQQVATRLARYYDVAAPIPLGSFHSNLAEKEGFLLLKHPPYSEKLLDVGLAEIYWANIPRAVQAEKYTLEESKKWAASLSGRIRLRVDANQKHLAPVVYETIDQVIDEMIEGVAVLDRLFFLLSKMTTFKFRLKKLLDDFLGDVQIVTDFETKRGELLGHFNAVMEKIYQANPDIEIYIVAHSEGTVVAFLGLLTAALQNGASGDLKEQRYPWLNNIRGLMTIGSPIEEHLILWPELFEPFEDRSDPVTGTPQLADRWQPGGQGPGIRWRNYCDAGDPIAYKLVETEDWLERNRWKEVFEFDRARHEFAFSRYPFPGKAHTDYWEDAEVFSHFINDVVKPPGATTPKPPASSKLISCFSRVVPYLVPALLLFTGVFLLFQSIRTFLLGPRMNDPLDFTMWNVAGLWSLFAGLSLAARIPRLTRSTWALVASWGMLAIGMIGYNELVAQEIQNFLVPRAGRSDSADASVARIYQVVVAAIVLIPALITLAVQELSRQYKRRGAALLVFLTLLSLITVVACYCKGLADFWLIPAVIVLIAQAISLQFPKAGARVLVVLGVLAVLLVAGLPIAYSIGSSGWHDRGSLPNMLLGGAIFVYLWWLSVVMFDLIFVWHHYVRGSARGATVLTRLRATCASGPDGAGTAARPAESG